MEDALALVQRALEAHPDDAALRTALVGALLLAGQAQTLLDAGRPDKAAELYQAMHALLNDAYSASGQDPTIGLNLARAIAADGDPERARAMLRTLVAEAFPQRAEAQALLRQLSAP